MNTYQTSFSRVLKTAGLRPEVIGGLIGGLTGGGGYAALSDADKPVGKRLQEGGVATLLGALGGAGAGRSRHIQRLGRMLRAKTRKPVHKTVMTRSQALDNSGSDPVYFGNTRIDKTNPYEGVVDPEEPLIVAGELVGRGIEKRLKDGTRIVDDGEVFAVQAPTRAVDDAGRPADVLVQGRRRGLDPDKAFRNMNAHAHKHLTGLKDREKVREALRRMTL